MSANGNFLSNLWWIAAPPKYLLGCIEVIILCLTLALSHLKIAVIKLFLFLSCGKKFDVLSGTDASFLYSGLATFTDPTCATTIHAVVCITAVPNIHQIREAVKVRMVEARVDPRGPKKYPRLTQKVVRKFGYFVWEEVDSFCVDEMVILHPNGYSDTASLMGMLQEIMAVPLNFESSPWKIVIIPKLSTSGDGADEFTLILRVHHSMSDGFRCLQMLAEFYDAQATKDVELDMKGHLAKSAFINKNPFIRFMSSPSSKMTATRAMDIIFDLAKTIFLFPWHCTEVFKLGEESNALHLPKKVLSGRKLLGISRHIEVQLFRDVAKAAGCSVNDIFLYLLTRLVSRCNEDVSMVTDPSVRALFPVLLVPGSSWSQNGVAGICIELPIPKGYSENDLKILSERSRNIKSSSMAISNFISLHVTGNHLPLPLAKFFLVDLPTYSLILTNIIGPTIAPTIQGEQITEMFGIPDVTGNAGASFCLFSFAGKARLTVSVDRVVASSDQMAWQLTEAFEEELQKLHEQLKRTAAEALSNAAEHESFSI